MFALLDPSVAVLGAAGIAAAAGFAALWFQTRLVHRDNRADHAATAEVVAEMRDDVREVKADVREVRAQQRSHTERISRLELPAVTVTTTVTPTED